MQDMTQVKDVDVYLFIFLKSDPFARGFSHDGSMVLIRRKYESQIEFARLKNLFAGHISLRHPLPL